MEKNEGQAKWALKKDEKGKSSLEKNELNDF